MDNSYRGDVSEQTKEGARAAPEAAELRRRIDQAKDFEQSDAARLAQSDDARIEDFKKAFGDREGADHVLSDATHGTDKDRIGALHQMDVAQELGSRVACFEESIHPVENGQAAARAHHVDIVTTDDFAVECKATAKPETYPSQLRQDAFEQATTRLAANTEGRQYRGVTVVFEDGKLSENMRRMADQLEAQQPGLRFCERSQVNQVLSEMRQQPRR